jgi:outer membrane biosynthesis protein TonB
MRLRSLGALLILLGSTTAPGHPQEPTVAPQAPIRVPGDFMTALLQTSEMPASIKADVSGTIVLQVLIGKDGHVKQVSAVTGPDILRASYIDAVRQWTYKPYLVDGKPVEVETFIEISAKWGVPSFEKPIRVSGGVMAGTILTKGSGLVFPCEAIKQHVNGSVVMHVIIGKDGHIKDISAISGPELLRAAFMDTVRQWTYRPYLLNGTPVEVDTTVSMSVQMGGGPYPQCP